VGLVERYSATGTLAQLFETNNGTQLGQMAFDTSRNLYVASFSGGDGSPNALEFDPAGTESFFIVSNLFSANSFAFDKAGNAYQGGSGGAIEQFDANGQPRTTFAVTVDPTSPSGNGEVDYLDVAADQCAIYYTSRGTQIKGFNICTNQQLAKDFADNIGTPAPPTAGPVSFANELRIRPNGEILLADSDFVIRFAANGTVMQNYSTPAGKNTFTGLSLDPDGTSFWTSQGTGEIDHFDIATGNLLSSFQTPFGIGEAVAVLGEIRAATNQGPTCTLRVVPNTGTNPLAVTVTGNCTDPTATITSTTLDLGDGTTQTGPSGTHTYTSAGTFIVKLSATDANGPFTSVTQSVTVAVNQPPTCTLVVAPATGVAPLNVTATGNCTDPENDITTTKLDYGDGTTQTATSGPHSYTKAGVFTVTVTATDVASQTATATQTVTVGSSLAPVCTLTVTPQAGQTPLAVTATGTCSGTNTIRTIVLDYGDGATSNTIGGTHTYSQAGTFTVKLTATDAFGLTGSATQTVVASSNNFPQGVFIGVGGGKIMQFATNGTALKTLDTTAGGTIADMAFDKGGNLYAVGFTAAKVSKFNLTSGTLSGTFGSGYDCQPESMVFDGAGNAYVGQQGCAQTILKFDPNGNFLTSYQVATEEQGSDDLALSGDECTMLYTSEGPSILRYDVCQKKQLAPFATGLNKTLSLKILPDGGVLVADLTDIVRLNSSGQRVTTYTVPNQNCLYGIALDQDGTTFWADDYCSSNIDHIDINSGKVLSTFNTGTPSGTVFGLAISGSGLNVAGIGNGGSLTASPQSATLGAGQSAAFTVTFIPNAAAAGRTLALSCAGLPPGLSCSFNPPTITLGAAGTSSTATLTITRTMTAALLHPSSPWMLATWMGVVPAIVLMGFRSPRRRRSSMLCLALIVATTGIWTSCGGRGSSSMTTTPTTPPGSYTIIVVGNASGVQASTTVNVTAQ
jgi:PKD repeat protein